jgi:hypothetical protein
MAPFTASAPLLPALVQERAARTPLATVWVLNTLEPVIDPLRRAIAGLPAASAAWFDQRLQRNGGAIVFRGHLEAARRYETNLKAAGLTTSVNLLMPH